LAQAGMDGEGGGGDGLGSLALRLVNLEETEGL